MQSATHFVDLMRFLGGDIVEESISAVRVGPEADLSDLPPKSEQQVSFGNRHCMCMPHTFLQSQITRYQLSTNIARAQEGQPFLQSQTAGPVGSINPTCKATMSIVYTLVSTIQHCNAHAATGCQCLVQLSMFPVSLPLIGWWCLLG